MDFFSWIAKFLSENMSLIYKNTRLLLKSYTQVVIKNFKHSGSDLHEYIILYYVI